MNDLAERIEAMDWRRPYVWRLKVSSSEFAALEAAVAAGTTTARQNVVYLAEWYKRCYDGGTAKPVKPFDAKTLVEEAGIDRANLFATAGGKTTWEYSVYVLGGVAMAFEQKKRDTRFLKELCRLYYGEDRDVDDLDIRDKGRAVAFRESVRTKGCLYEYLKETLAGLTSGDLPFAAEDLADPRSQVHGFLESVRRANDAVCASKFDVEWTVFFDPYVVHLTRKLRLRLRPETAGGTNHRYLNYDRIRQWGVAPETCRRLVVGVRYLRGDAVVAEPDFDRPLLDFLNTGREASGFLAWATGCERYSRSCDVPVKPFDAVEIVVRDDRGGKRVLERVPVCEWMQVFRVPGGYNEWTTRRCEQRDSALVCPATCEMLDVEPSETIYEKKFRVKGGAVSETYRWRSVNGTVRFRNAAGEIVSLYNRQGYDQIVTRQHRDILRYHDGCVSYTEERDDEVEESWLPLVFGKDDILVRHFETRSDLSEVATEGACDRVEFRDGDGYREWTDDCKPRQGKVKFRLTARGVERKLVAYYLPAGIRRDCARHAIAVGDEVIADAFRRDGVPAEPVVYKSVGTDAAFVSLEIWRATNHKEIIRDGRVVKYVEEGGEAEISYALKDGLTIHDFGIYGFCEYDCGDIGNVHALGEYANHGHAAIVNQYRERAKDRLDALAPGWLWVNLTKKAQVHEGMRMFYWNYLADTNPEEVAADFACRGNDIVFQSLKGFSGCCVATPAVGNTTPFTYARVRSQVDLLKCFEVATEHRVYYAAFYPLKNLDGTGVAGLEERLIARRGGAEKLTEEDRQGLQRFKDELGVCRQA